MKVKCAICDKIETIDNHTPLAKKLRNRPIHTYMCNECSSRIKVRTEERKATGNFKLFESKTSKDKYIQ